MSARKLSKVSAEEMTMLNEQLEAMFNEFKDDETGITKAGIEKFCTNCKLFDNKLKSSDCGMIFEAVKVRKKTTLNFDRFQEAVRKIALGKEVTYQELIQMASECKPRARMDAGLAPNNKSLPDYTTSRDADTGDSSRGMDQYAREVRSYPGYSQSACRLCFNYEDGYGKADLQTIMPSGHVESTKALVPKLGKGLLTYSFPQFMESLGAATPHLGSPFVWEQDSDLGGISAKKYVVVQTWSTNYNQSFKDSYKVSSENPDPAKFDQVASANFRRTIQHLFGDKSVDQPILYCEKITNCPGSPVYTGSCSALLTMLRTHASAAQELGITNVGESGFTCTTVDGNGKEGSFKFQFGSTEEEYALYVKAGWDTMACITPLQQFLRAGATLHRV
jgi:hypothetical protein